MEEGLALGARLQGNEPDNSSTLFVHSRNIVYYIYCIVFIIYIDVILYVLDCIIIVMYLCDTVANK